RKCRCPARNGGGITKSGSAYPAAKGSATFVLSLDRSDFGLCSWILKERLLRLLRFRDGWRRNHYSAGAASRSYVRGTCTGYETAACDLFGKDSVRFHPSYPICNLRGRSGAVRQFAAALRSARETHWSARPDRRVCGVQAAHHARRASVA